MYTYYDKQKNMVPIRIWLPKDEIEENVLTQAINLSKLPFAYKWIALMPDCHYGYGMPIGGVLAAKDALVPNAVGKDIGCGMCYIQTNILYEELKQVEHDHQPLLKLIINQTMRDIPVGFSTYKEKQPSKVIDQALIEMADDKSLPDSPSILENSYFQVGTLGGGNHFIEYQQDEKGYIGIMIHSGSRNLGAKICDHFNREATRLNELWYHWQTSDNQLAFLPIHTQEGQNYLKWMNIAMDFAYENREQMLKKTMDIFSRFVDKFLDKKVDYSMKVNCHHNYAALELHYDKKVWVHRKGATRARKGELGIIPGAMGSYSYITEGLGNPESFCSSSHGAGRVYSRTKAKETFSVESVIVDLKEKNVVLGKVKKNDVAEESRFAYKNIDDVIANQTELVIPVKKLKTVGVIKG